MATSSLPIINSLTRYPWPCPRCGKSRTPGAGTVLLQEPEACLQSGLFPILVTLLLWNGLTVDSAVSTRYEPDTPSLKDNRIIPSAQQEKVVQQPIKRHIFYTTGWGGAGSGLPFKPPTPSSKRLPDSAIVQKVINGGPSFSGIPVPQTPPSPAAAKLLQFFVSRGWGPGWAR